MKRALISVYDKNGIVEFAQKLDQLGWEIISTGGTKSLLEEAGIKVVAVEEVTHSPEILEGRVKTLHPHIHGGILFNRDITSHQETVDEMGIRAIDMVVNSLYPFEDTVKNANASKVDIIEKIDVGGPSMIRAAAKNYKDVLIVTSADDYAVVADALENNKNTLELRESLAAKAFRLTAFYDAMIAEYFTEQAKEKFPELLTKAFRYKETLRYGENPHQAAVYYESPLEEDFDLEQLHGKQISYNNYNDMRANMELVQEFEEPVCVAVKHANPCGVAVADTVAEAYRKAFEGDPVSIFGGIIGFNRTVDAAAAEQMAEIFLEIIVAPDFTEEAFTILSKKKNLRLVKSTKLGQFKGKTTTYKETVGGLLVQDKDLPIYAETGLELKSDRQVTEKELEDMDFAWKVAKHCASNAMVIAKDKQTFALGHGEVRRVWALEDALQRSEFPLEGAVVASDGFFFPDTIESLHKYGIKAIVQPGGSVQDEKVIEAAKAYDISVLFTGMRHFKH